MASIQPVSVGARGAGGHPSGAVRGGASSVPCVGPSEPVTYQRIVGRDDRGVQAARLDPDEIGVFDIIYADPPWAYGDTMFNAKEPGRAAGHSAARMHYETMTPKSLKELPVPSIAAENCLLFLWVTSPNLDVAFEIIKAWKFKHATVAFIWHKQRVNAGNYTMSQCEMVLVAKRGKIPQPRGARNVRQFLSEKATSHSRKPDEIRHRIEDMFPKQRKIELFARGAPAPGWTAWGNEVNDA